MSMEVLYAHQKKVAKSRDILDTLLALELKAYGIRNESWGYQMQNDENTKTSLADAHRRIDEITEKMVTLRADLAPGVKWKPVEPQTAFI